MNVLKIKSLPRGTHGDGGGLYLSVKGGGRSWLFRHKRAGKTCWVGLGAFPAVGLAAAREAAAAARRQLADGVDPLAARRAVAAVADAQPVHTFADVAEAWLAAHAGSYRNAKHAAQVRTTLATYAFPTLGRMPVAEITTADVLGALKPVWNRAPETASRLRGRIEGVLSYAKALGWREGANPAAWRDNLDHLLPATSKVRRVEHHAALPWQEMPGFMAALRQREGIGALALQFTILTAARSGETRGATWGEIDLAGAVWTVPGERMKAGREHRVPLSDAALAILADMALLRDPKAGAALIFVGAKRGRPLSDMSLTAVLRRMARGDLTAHGFRSTFRDWAGEATEFPRELAEAALAHTLRDRVEAAYRRGDALERRRVLMESWAAFCAGPAPQESRTRSDAGRVRLVPGIARARNMA
ncbi:MAG: integrase arm-type DNA-binding domain-containing protein [Rhodospirillales bacterium]|nr:integrase arm-type DNA-binding domain-containing protein [Rhodospirillales bacterium]